MKVLIVSKTHMFDNACVGALTYDKNVSIRLLGPHGDKLPSGIPYEVGYVWDVEFVPAPQVVPPHVEDVYVQRHRLMGEQMKLRDALLDRVRPMTGGPQNLYEGTLCLPDKLGSAYVCKGNVPGFSTGFWLPDRPLVRQDFRDQVRYNYLSPDVNVSFPYVGFYNPIDHIPVGTLVRLSLARSWDRKGETDPRCYVQLSGWYL